MTTNSKDIITSEIEAPADFKGKTPVSKIQKDEKDRVITAQLYTPSGSDSYSYLSNNGTSQSSKYSSDAVKGLLADHVTNGKKLRGMSDYLCATNGIYGRLVDTTKNLISYEHSLIPMISNKEKINEKIYSSKLNKIKQYLWNCNFDATLDDIIFKLVKYGRYSGFDRGTYIQPLPVDYTRVVGVESDGNPIIQFDFSYFDKYLTVRERNYQFKGFDNFFLVQYQKYKKGIDNVNENFVNELKWRRLPPEKTYTFKTGVNMECAEGLGLLYGTIDEILYYDEVKSLDKAVIASQKRKIIIQQLPVDKDMNSVLGEADIVQAHENLKSLVPSNVGVLTVLGGTKIAEVPLQLSAMEKNKTQEIKDDILTSSGIGEGALKGGNFSTGVLNVEVLTNTVMKMLKQIESIWFYRKFNSLVGTGQYKFKLKFLGITPFNKEDIISAFDGLLDKGGNLSLSVNARGLGVDEYMDILSIENTFKFKDAFKPLQTSSTMSGENGRPSGSGEGGDSSDNSNSNGGNDSPSPSD